MDLFQDILEVLREYMEASEKFIIKVNTGQAKSIETYNDLVKCTIKAKNVIEEIEREEN